jgi:hypothetical protein
VTTGGKADEVSEIFCGDFERFGVEVVYRIVVSTIHRDGD